MLTKPNLKGKIEHPEDHYKNPDEIGNDSELSAEQKGKEQDAREMLTASNEGMAGSKEGIARDDQSRFDMARGTSCRADTETQFWAKLRRGISRITRALTSYRATLSRRDSFILL
jgi:hypothetical protein